MDAFLVNGGIRSNTLSPEESARYFTDGISNAFSSTKNVAILIEI